MSKKIVEAVELVPVRNATVSSDIRANEFLLGQLDKALLHLRTHGSYFREGLTNQTENQVNTRVLLELMQEQVLSLQPRKSR